MVTWGEIIQECENYRDGFVAVFRRYEGQPTEEKDGQGRTVKVTVPTFARHMGIPEKTFRVWTKSATRAGLPRPPSYLARDVKRAASSEPSAVVDGIMAASDKAQDQIFHDLKLRRAGVDTSTAARKGANASAHQQTEPIRRAMATADVALCVAALHDATEHLEAVIAAGALNDETMAEIGAAHEAFQFALTEARFRVSP